MEHAGLLQGRQAGGGGRFIFLTKTNWEEPPRIRHQLARLLAERGHCVTFGERPGTKAELPHLNAEGITTFRHTELLHHKLRGHSLLRSLNAAWTVRSLRATLSSRPVDASDVLVNFNYDYYFLRSIAPHSPIVTVINDDFISSAPRLVQPALYRAQDLTCRSSGAVLCTSPIVAKALGEPPKPELFLPWAAEPYRPPASGTERNVLLFWGFAGRRLDVAVIHALMQRARNEMPDLRIRFVGPRDRTFGEVSELEALEGIEFHDSTPLDRLRLDDVIACFIPYVSGVPDVDAIVFPNKIFQMLGVGLPMVVSGMPHFVKEPFVFRMNPGEELAAVVDARRSFATVQESIELFLRAHTPQRRYEQFIAAIDRARAAVGSG
jgi:hypothetical protein